MSDIKQECGNPMCWEDEDACPNRQACCDAEKCLYTRQKAEQEPDWKAVALEQSEIVAKMTKEKYPFVHLRFDVGAAETESALRSKLIELGWTPPDMVEQEHDDLTIAYMSGFHDGKKNYKNNLVKQARYVRNYSNTEESFKAVPLRFILEESECRFEAKLKEKNT